MVYPTNIEPLLCAVHMLDTRDIVMKRQPLSNSSEFYRDEAHRQADP